MATGRVPTTANSPLTAKGDLFSYSTAPARLAVGNDGEQIVADSSTSTGLRWIADTSIGRNCIINSRFDFWQRGTSFTVGAVAYGADRFWSYQDGNGVATISRQTFSPQNDQDYFMRYSLSSLGTTTSAQIGTKIENVSTLAGKTATFSTYIKADSSRSNLVNVFAEQNFGSGGSASVYTNLGTFSVTNSFTRPTLTAAIPSVSGKTIGAGSFLSIYFQFIPATSLVLDIYAWQLEEGSVATMQVRTAATIQGELAACQRYYWRKTSTTEGRFGFGSATDATQGWVTIRNPVTMRANPTSIEFSGVTVSDGVSYTLSVTAIANTNPTPIDTFISYTCNTGQTARYPAHLNFVNNVGGHFGVNAEL